MEENQTIDLSGYHLVFFTLHCAGQDDQETQIELCSSNAGYISVCIWEVDTLSRPNNICISMMRPDVICRYPDIRKADAAEGQFATQSRLPRELQ